MQYLLECRGIISGCLRGLLGHLLEANHLVDASTAGRRELVDIGDALGESGVDQPVADIGTAQKQAGQLGLGEFASAFPIRVGVDVSGQPQNWCAVRAHRETQLRVEPRVGNRIGVGLIERVFEAPPVPAVSQQPCTC